MFGGIKINTTFVCINIKQLEIMKASIYTSNFENGIITISRGVDTKYDWKLSIELNKDKNGNKQFIFLDQNIFLTKKSALIYATKLLTKYKLL